MLIKIIIFWCLFTTGRMLLLLLLMHCVNLNWMQYKINVSLKVHSYLFIILIISIILSSDKQSICTFCSLHRNALSMNSLQYSRIHHIIIISSFQLIWIDFGMHFCYSCHFKCLPIFTICNTIHLSLFPSNGMIYQKQKIVSIMHIFQVYFLIWILRKTVCLIDNLWIWCNHHTWNGRNNSNSNKFVKMRLMPLIKIVK